MKLKDLISVIDSDAFLNIITESRQWLYMDNAVFLTSDLLERTVKEVGIPPLKTSTGSFPLRYEPVQHFCTTSTILILI